MNIQLWITRTNRKGELNSVVVDDCATEDQLKVKVDFWQKSECLQPSKGSPAVVLGLACFIPQQEFDSWTQAEMEEFTALTPEEADLAAGRAF